MARQLLGERLAACINITGKVTSLYWWRDEICEEDEVLLIIKTRTELFERLRARIEELHEYDVPEIVALEASEVNEPYLAWIKKETVEP